VYGGPQLPTVQDVWRGSHLLWHFFLAQQGYIIWMCDNRSASNKGVAYTWPIHRNFGELEFQDVVDGVNFLKQKPYVDGKRIGIWGWSFGGYLTAYALTHSDLFKMGISGAPVTDWALYDTIYTERYMGTPQGNPDGYKKASILEVAPKLSGKLLLIHGLIDDNVHIQNTIQLLDVFQKHNKQVQLMVYAGARHGVTDPAAARHLRHLMTNYILENL